MKSQSFKGLSIWEYLVWFLPTLILVPVGIFVCAGIFSFWSGF